jgi:hypothetical protein
MAIRVHLTGGEHLSGFTPASASQLILDFEWYLAAPDADAGPGPIGGSYRVGPDEGTETVIVNFAHVLYIQHEN